MNLSLTKPLESAPHVTEKIGQKPKFGTFIGVYVPSILMLFGVIIFLRLGWIVGAAGLYPTLIIITLATLITLITTLSMSAAATNISVGKGGAYYMISRALGIEIGSAIGLPLFVKQSIAVSFCIVGFAESLHALLPQFSVALIGISTLGVLTILAYISTDFVLKIQLFIFVAIIASLYSLFAGESSVSETLHTTDQSMPYSFWTVFAIFFPAMTGLESSVSLSGDLKKPSFSLPLGTITAVATAYGIYMAIPFFLWNSASSEQLLNDPMIIPHLAKYESLIILGIWGATLSSAIGGLLGAPRTLQALAEDKILPSFLAKEFGPYREPRIATAVTVLLALIGICFGSINALAPVLTMICLICYATLNLATGLEDLIANPSWRPAFPIHWSVSFIGAGLCGLAMLMINSGAAIIATIFVVGIYAILKQKQLTSKWEDISYGILMFFSRFILYRLAWQEPSSRSWRPNFLVFTGRPSEASNEILSFASAISRSKGFLSIASILSPEQYQQDQLTGLHQNIKSMLKQFRIEALVSLNKASSVASGMKRVILHYGLGPLTPNTIVFGGNDQPENLMSYLEVIKLAHEQGRHVVIINDEQKKLSSHVLLRHKMKGEILIWWDDISQNNTKLMLIFAYMLRKNPIWKQATICIMGRAKDEKMKLQKEGEFNALIKHNRLRINKKVLIADDPEMDDLAFIEQHSAQAAMIFLSMRPHREVESPEEYARYFQTLPHKSQSFPSVALVMSAFQTNLQEVMSMSSRDLSYD